MPAAYDEGSALKNNFYGSILLLYFSLLVDAHVAFFFVNISSSSWLIFRWLWMRGTGWEEDRYLLNMIFHGKMTKLWKSIDESMLILAYQLLIEVSTSFRHLTKLHMLCRKSEKIHGSLENSREKFFFFK